MDIYRILALIICGLALLEDLALAQMTPMERIKLQKEWLERRALLKGNRLNSTMNSVDAIKSPNSSSEKSTYFRRIIKFRTQNQPISTNDISFMPKQDFDPDWSHQRSNNYNKYDVINVNSGREDKTVTNEMTTTTGRTSTSQEDDNLNMSSTTSAENEVLDSRNSYQIDNEMHLKQNERVTNEIKTLPEETTTESATTITTEPSPLTTTDPPTTEDNEIITTSTEIMTTSTTTTPRTWIEKIKTKPPSILNRKPPTPVNSTTKPRAANATKNWGPWDKWSECSRSCGGGIRSQKRECLRITLKQNNSTNSPDCIGIYKRFHICNDQPCPESEGDFRAKQCTQFNNQSFRGKTYTWEPYVKDDAECELNCKPVGLNYFASLKETVIDGTSCKKPAEYFKRKFDGRAICVEGICKAVHSSGVVVGAYMNNGAVRCGPLICRPVTGIFTQSILPNGYHNVATIPQYASNISITEMKHTKNFLVLKSDSQKYIINGDYNTSPSGSYEVAGAVFDYHRIDNQPNGKKMIDGVTEWITGMGPIDEPVHLMVLIHQSNPGIKYEYLLPINVSPNPASEEEEVSSSETGATLKKSTTPSEPPSKPQQLRKRRFSWKIVKFNPCTKTCGGGIQTPIIKCVREGSTKISPPKKCVHLNKPVLNENQLRCNTKPCPPYWQVSDWTECKCGGGEIATQTREIKCVQELNNDRIIQVHDGACSSMDDVTPELKKDCDCPKPLPARLDTHRRPGHHHGHHNRGNGVSIIRNPRYHGNGTGGHRRPKKGGGAWLMSNWSESCSTECGTGIQYRSIFCDRSPPTTDRCDLKNTPDTTRQCTSERKCNFGDWFTGPWSSCSGDCFNLTKSRSIFCVRDEVIMPEQECDFNDKPEHISYCELTDSPECSPRWHTSEWTECTKPCDEGNQRRVVKCLEPNIKEKQMKESDSCSYNNRPPAFRSCNKDPCNESGSNIDPKVDLIQNDVTPECKDEFPNCYFVIRAKLCKHAYYEKNCCRTCNQLE